VNNLPNEYPLSLLKKNVMFKGFNYENLEDLQHIYRINQYKKNQLIESANSISKEIHFIICGGIKRALQKSDKRDYIFEVTQSNNLDCFFIEWSSKMPSSTDLISTENKTCVVSIALADWDQFLYKHPKLRQKFIDYLFLKYQIIEKRISMQLLSFNSNDRYRLAENEFSGLNRALTKKEKGAYIGVAPETISRLCIPD
jgi:CRP-like cAMP-binding protein